MNLLFGSIRLSGIGNVFLHQDIDGVGGAAEQDDEFANNLAAGDFNADGKFDLVVGVPTEDFVGFDDAGVFHVFYDLNSLVAPSIPNQLWHQDKDGLVFGVEAGDEFSSSFGVGDFNGDGFQDLAAGAPGESYAGTMAVGGVAVLDGSSGGLVVENQDYWSENHPKFSMRFDASDEFGFVLSQASALKRVDPKTMAVSICDPAVLAPVNT